MEKAKLQIRVATKEDAEALLAIYAPYVEKTAITFEYEVPSIEEFRCRIQETLKKYPYLVAEKNRRIVGYAYASCFKNRAAYDWCVETSIYVNYDLKRCGIGKKLYLALEKALKAQHFKRLHRLSGTRGRASDQGQRALPYTPWLPDGWGVLPVRV